MVVHSWIIGSKKFQALTREAVSKAFGRTLAVAGASEQLNGIPGKVQVVLIEHSGKMGAILDQCRSLREKTPEVKIIVISSGEEDISGVEIMIANGISGYLTINAGREELTHCLRKVLDEGLYLCTGFVLRMIKHGERPAINIQLNSREQEVLDLIAEGHSNKEIAEKLFLSVRTVESRRKKLLEKTGCSNTATLVRFAVLNMLVK